jgi:hypothetical protein
MSPSQNAGQNPDIRSDNEAYERVAKLACFGTAMTDPVVIRDEIKSRLNPGKCLL